MLQMRINFLLSVVIGVLEKWNNEMAEQQDTGTCNDQASFVCYLVQLVSYPVAKTTNQLLLLHGGDCERRATSILFSLSLLAKSFLTFQAKRLMIHFF